MEDSEITDKEIKEEQQTDPKIAKKLEESKKKIEEIQQQIKNCDSNLEKKNLEKKYFKELKKRKELVAKSASKHNILIPDKVANKIKDISKSIKIMMNKKHIIQSLSSAAKNTVISTAVVGALMAGLTVVTGGTITLATLTALVPTAAYLGLSNLIKAPFTQTKYKMEMEDYLDSLDPEKKKVVQDYLDNLSKDTTLSNLIVNKNKNISLKDKADCEEQIITILSKYIKEAPNDEIKYNLRFMKLDCMDELKKYYAEICNNYVTSKEDSSFGDYSKAKAKELKLAVAYAKEDSNLRMYLDSKGNIKNAAVLNLGSLLTAKALLTPIFPSLAITSVVDVIKYAGMTVFNAAVGEKEKLMNKLKFKKSKYDKAVTSLTPENIRKISEVNDYNLEYEDKENSGPELAAA